MGFSSDLLCVLKFIYPRAFYEIPSKKRVFLSNLKNLLFFWKNIDFCSKGPISEKYFSFFFFISHKENLNFFTLFDQLPIFYQISSKKEKKVSLF